MNNAVILSMPIVLIITAAIVLLHIASAVFSALRTNTVTRVVSIILAVINAVAHLALIAYSLAKDVPTEELLLLLMLSSAVGIVSMGISEKRKKAEEEGV